MILQSIVGYKNFSLRKPLTIDIERISKEEYIGGIPKLEITCFGESVQEVKAYVVEEVIELYNDIANIPYCRLGRFPSMWKRFLSNHIIKNKSN